MKLCDYNGYEIHIPTSGGKAGAGHQATMSIQVRKGNEIVKNIRFKPDDAASRTEAIRKAKEFCTHKVTAPQGSKPKTKEAN